MADANRGRIGRLIYSLLLYLLIPFEVLRLLLRSRQAPDYRQRWSERFATRLPDCEQGAIWFHTVSVGETLAAVPVIRAIMAQYPERPVLVTTMTPTGSARVKAAFGESVCHCYAPYDLPHALNRFMHHLKPACLMVMETELWPNMIHHASRRLIPVVLMNARMSEKSSRGYLRFASLSYFMLSRLSHLVVQYPADAERFKRMGATQQQITISGNIKFDLTIPENLTAQVSELRAAIPDRPVWLAASTHQGEDEIILDAHQQLLRKYPDSLLVLVPRHPERFEQVFNLCQTSGFKVSRRTESDKPVGQVYLADTMGELLLFCALADMVFIGGSLVPTGGHNCLEAALFKKPVMSGPHDFNFAEINRQLREAGGLVTVTDSSSLYAQLSDWIEQPELANRTGLSGYQVVQKNRGALNRLLEVLTRTVEQV